MDPDQSRREPDRTESNRGHPVLEVDPAVTARGPHYAQSRDIGVWSHILGSQGFELDGRRAKLRIPENQS